MASDPLLIQVGRGSALHRQLTSRAPQPVARGEALVEAGPADPKGRHLEPPAAGEVVLTVPSPEGLARERDQVRRVIARAGTGVEPLVIVVEAAEELRDDELAPVLEASKQSSRPVILRVIRDV